jgi:L-asparaginase
LKVLIINTGGTFNKIYNPINGQLEIQNNDEVIENLLKSIGSNHEFKIIGTIYKDSLEMNDDDREKISETLLTTEEKKVIIIHGTDTIHETAQFLSERIFGKTIVLVGAMKPISINPIDGTLNLGVALGFLQHDPFDRIYISMSGLILPFEKITKNREFGVFQENKSN